MNRQPTSRIVSVIVMLFCMLCAQIAAAECKAMRNAGSLDPVPASAQAVLAGDMQDSAPDLCKRQMQAPDDALAGNTGAQAGSFPTFIAATLRPILPQRHAPALLPAPAFASMHARATAPPLRIRHCSLRI